jgi:hypothetical protein
VTTIQGSFRLAGAVQHYRGCRAARLSAAATPADFT